MFVVEAKPFALPAACTGLCYWLIESVFCSAALPWRLALAHTHCKRTNENTPHHLPRRDTPSLSPCPSTLVSLSFYSFHLIFIPSCCTLFLCSIPQPPLPFPTFYFLPSHFLLFYFVLHCLFYTSVCVRICRVKVLPYSDHWLSECLAWSIGADTEGDPWSATLETNFIKMNLSRGAVLTAA